VVQVSVCIYIHIYVCVYVWYDMMVASVYIVLYFNIDMRVLVCVYVACGL
jgi:hypothetical protein